MNLTLKTTFSVFWGIILIAFLLQFPTQAQVRLPGGLGGGGGGSGGGGLGSGSSKSIIDDSTKVIYGPHTALHYFENDILNNRDSVRYRVDTLLKNFQRWSPIDRSWGTLVDLGNTGTASRNLFFKPREEIGTQLGMRAYDTYAIDANEVQYIDTKSQYTDLTFVNGGKKTTLGRFGYSQNIHARWNFGFRGQRLTSTKQYGAYSTINSESLLGQNWTALIHTSYHSENKKYSLLAHYRHLNQKVREQGGVIVTSPDNPYPYDGTAKISNDANSWERRHAFRLYQQYRLANGFQLFQQAEYQSVINRYTDKDIAIGVEKGIYPTPIYNPDTTRQDIYSKVFDNKIGIKGQYKEFNYRAYLRNRLYGVKSLSQPSEDAETLFTTYRTRLKFDNILGLWLGYYLKDSSNYLTAEGALNLVNAEYSIKGDLHTKWGKVGIQSISTEPDILAQRYVGNHFSWQNNFSPTNVVTMYGQLPLKTASAVFTPEIQIHQINNFVYYDTIALPRQLNEGFRLYRIGATTDIQLNRWNFQARGFVTLNENGEVIRIPKFFGSGQVTFDFVYAKVLFIQLGMSAIYRSAYLADAYMPLTQQFHLQNTSTLQARAVVDAFANVRIKRVRLFFKMSYLNQGSADGLFPQGYYITPGYIGAGRAFSFGVNWPLFD